MKNCMKKLARAALSFVSPEDYRLLQDSLDNAKYADRVKEVLDIERASWRITGQQLTDERSRNEILIQEIHRMSDLVSQLETQLEESRGDA